MRNGKNEISRAEKRKIEYKQKNKKNKMLTIISIAIITMICIGVYYVIFLKQDENSINRTTTSTIPDDDSQIKIQLSSINDEAQFYSYNSKDTTINYFAVKGSDGNIHVALDACDVCYGAKKGYRQIDGVMHCINCGQEFSINDIGTSNTAGGCWPSYLPINIDGENIIINVTDLEAKQYMFL